MENFPEEKPQRRGGAEKFLCRGGSSAGGMSKKNHKGTKKLYVFVGTEHCSVLLKDNRRGTEMQREG